MSTMKNTSNAALFADVVANKHRRLALVLVPAGRFPAATHSIVLHAGFRKACRLQLHDAAYGGLDADACSARKPVRGLTQGVFFFRPINRFDAVSAKSTPGGLIRCGLVRPATSIHAIVPLTRIEAARELPGGGADVAVICPDHDCYDLAHRCIVYAFPGDP